MSNKPQEVRVYQTEDGKRPFNLWMRRLRDTRARQRIRARIERVGLGNFGDPKSVGDAVIELRVDYGPGYRVYFGRDGDEVVILLIGGDKRKQDRDISMAKDYWADYKARKEDET